MEDLLDIGDDLCTYLNFYILDIEKTNDPELVAAAAATISDHYEALGIVELLVDANTKDFYNHLIRSAQTRRWLFSHIDLEKRLPDKFVKASRVRPFLAAITANQFDLARDIARLSSSIWKPDWEYEDDFLYAHFLHKYMLHNSANELKVILSDFEGVLEGQESTKLKLCNLLVNPDGSAAETIFEELIAEREVHIENLKIHSAYWDGGDAVIMPNTLVYIEGLAWLKLLESVGIRLNDEYRFCPSLVRGIIIEPFEVTTFPAVPL